jgi:hypothetical protein
VRTGGLILAACLVGTLVTAYVYGSGIARPVAPHETVGDQARRICTQEVGPDRDRVERCVTMRVLKTMHDDETARTDRMFR